MSRIFCIGDIHGCSNTLDDLLVNTIKLKKTDHLVFVGDYIDRGPDSKGVIDIILNLEKKEYKTTCLLGNHEELFMESDLDDDIFIHWFKDCGGFDTLKSFNVPTYENLEEKYKYFFKSLLHYKIIQNKFIVVHAGINFNNEDIFSDKRALLWERNTQIDLQKIKNRLIIHGHTPQPLAKTKKQVLSIDNTRMINIDNGCFLNDTVGLGRLTCLELNTMKLYSTINRLDSMRKNSN